MAIVQFPAAAALQISAWNLGQQRFDLSERSDATGHTATRLGAPPRWRLRLVSLPGLRAAEAAAWKAMLLGLRGRINHLAVWDVTLPQPRGTARGNMVTSGTTAAGATSVAITGATPGGTLLVGDPLQIGTGVGSHYCVVTANATASGGGAITVNIEPATRASIGAVAWDKPVAHYKLVSDAVAWDAVAGSSDVGNFVLDLMEDWRP
jgi:hypothetical protein